MSVNGISTYSNWWQWQTQATAGSSASTTTTSSSDSDSITNSGSLAATSNVAAFMQAFSADLQAMLTQLGSDSTSTAASAASDTGTTASSTSQTASSQASGTVHHHHHPNGSDEGGSMDSAANQLVDEIGQTVQGGSLSSDQINQSASVFASDVMQALQSYGTTAPTAAGTSIVV
jgi:hypothetical protein